jgi:photosystem II stability/assembly factor-like uncharacterized protein
MSRVLRLFLLCGAIVVVGGAGQMLTGQTPGGAPVADQFERLHFRSIGPAIMSGRISDFAVYEANPAIFYVGTAHGGVFKTVNGGATFTPEFQQDGLMSVGDLAVSQKNPDLVWLGSGEGNNRQSTSWGDGIFKSTDGGKAWKNMGLTQSYNINRVVIDPNDNNIVFVASQGNLFAAGGERGVYRTTDGGATWKPVLKVDDDTGANDLVMDPTNSKILYASTYQRRRSQCCVNGGGPGSGIWKSTDGGDTWMREKTGMPDGPLGRIALDIYRKSPNILYAQIEAAAPAGARSGGSAGNAPGDSGTYRSDDGGASWKRVNANNERPLYFSQIRVDPNNSDRVITGGVRMQLSIDGGKTFQPIDQSEHDDKHALWWDPSNSDHMLIGTDGGAYTSWDMGHSWIFYPAIPAGLFYHVGFDYEYPYNVCGGMQDNYDWCGPSAVRTAAGISNDKWQSVQGGDGFVAIIDARNSQIIYTETQDGNTQRKNKVTGDSKSIRPTPNNVVNATPGEGAYRFNWDTPMLFSPNDAGVLYIAGNHVFRSTDRGDSWTAVSPDLTSNANRADIVTMGVKGSDIRVAANDGISAWPTIVSFNESAKMAGLYYAGTDDGNAQMSKDGGKTWVNITDRLPGFPKGGWVSKVQPSRYDVNTVYITSDSHRIGDYETHIWMSTDMGATFKSINGNLKGEAVKTLTEDQRNADVLYIGTETGIFVSLDRGKSWSRLKSNFPTVRVDEITLHPRDNAMLIATHGRAIWILDHISPIQEYQAATTGSAEAHLFSIDPALQWKSYDDKNDEFYGNQFFMGENPPAQAVIQFYLKNAPTELKLKITDALNKEVRTLVVPGTRLQTGIQAACWDMRVEPIATPGGAGANVGAGGRAGAGAGAGAAGAGAGAGAAGAQAGGGGRRGGGGGWATPQPEAGYSAGSGNPCGGGAGFGGGGGGGGRGGGGTTQGPLVIPGTYNVALVIDGKTIETKSMKVVGDPAAQMNDMARKRTYDVAMDLHEIQRRGEEAAAAMTTFNAQMSDIASKLDEKKVPADVKAQVTSLQKELDAVKPKFGVGVAAAGGGRGGGGGRGAGAGAPGAGAAGAGAGAPAAPQGGPGGFGAPQDAARENVVGRAGTVKGAVMAFAEMPSDTIMKDYADVKIAFPKAVSEANAVYAKAAAVSAALKKYDLTLTVPTAIK